MAEQKENSNKTDGGKDAPVAGGDSGKGTEDVVENKKESPKPVEQLSPTVTVAEYEALMKRVNMLETATTLMDKKVEEYAPQFLDRNWKKVESEDVVRQATVLKLRKNTDEEYSYAIDWKFFNKVWNAEKRRFDDVYKITWVLDDLNEKKKFETKMVWLEFCLEAEREVVEIIEMKTESYRSSTGKVRKTETEWSQYKSVETSEVVDLEVVQDFVVCVVKFPNGRTMVLPSNRLNA